MKPPISLHAALLAALVPAAASVFSHQETPPAPAPQGALERVDPAEEAPEGHGLGHVFQREFQRDEWLARLREPDLERRERSFDSLLKRARLDPFARAFIEELARDPAGELAWTARLGLRELGRVSFPVQGLNGILPGSDPLATSRRMEQMLQTLLAQDGMTFLLPQVQAGPGTGSGRKAGRSLHVEQDASGARVQIVDGQETTRTYSGTSLEQIFRDNKKQLAEELGNGFQVRAQPGFPLDLRFDLGGLRRLLGADGLDLAPQGRSRLMITDRLGVIVRNPVPAGGEPKSGLLVERTYPETYAHLLGVRAGNVLLELDGTPLAAVADIEQVMSARGPDDPLTLVWLDELGQRQEKTWRPAGGR